MRMKPSPQGKLRIIIITQPDAFVIPQNIQKIINCPSADVIAVYAVANPGALVNKKWIFVRGFGLFQAAKMAFIMAVAKGLELLDRAMKHRLLDYPMSIRTVAVRNDILYSVIDNPNQNEFVATVARLRPDLIISFSAPCVFKPALLAVPSLGCINLHCSYLPQYAGLFPSFWACFNGEKETGVTVHYMNDRIDNGRILAQEKVAIDPGMSVFQLIRKTKEQGGNLMGRVLESIAAGKAESLPNDTSKGSYFSWPTVEQMAEFRRRRGRLV